MEALYKDGTPKRVKVGPLWFGVEWVSRDETDRMNSFGWMHMDTQVIKVGNFLTPERTVCIFMHEVAHCIKDVCYRREKAEISEELMADIAGYALVQFWQDNPEVFDWVVSMIKAGG